MSIIQRLNGILHGDEDEEVMSKFLREQGSSATEAVREKFLLAFEAEKRDDLDLAEARYRDVLALVKQSDVVTAQLQGIIRKRT
jgi:hypothetical protein